MAEDLKVQLEHTQTKMREIQASVLDNRNARERESVNLKKAQVRCLRCVTRIEIIRDEVSETVWLLGFFYRRNYPDCGVS